MTAVRIKYDVEEGEAETGEIVATLNISSCARETDILEEGF